MEMKKWGLNFFGLCLLLVFSAGSVEAAPEDPCLPCARCDQDGDGIIKDSNSCRNKCDFPPFDDNDWIHVTGDLVCPVDDSTPTKYTVTLTGDMAGVSATDAWSEPKSGKNGIDLEAYRAPMDVNLDYFAGAIEGGGACFLEASATNLFAASIRQRNVKGGKQAEAGWWFVGLNKDGLPYNYVLQIFGTFDENYGVWPGEGTLVMTYWEMNDASSNGSTTPKACIDSGDFSTTIDIE